MGALLRFEDEFGILILLLVGLLGSLELRCCGCAIWGGIWEGPRSSDLVLVDLATEPRQDWCLWRHFAVLLEVKRNRSDGPNPAHGTGLTGLAAQLADMARLHLAARPFM